MYPTQQIVYQSAHFFYFNLLKFSMLIIPFQIIITSISLLLNQFSANDQTLWINIFFEVPANILFNAALIITLYHLNLMKNLSMWRVWIYASHYFPKLLVATLVSFACIGIGLILFILPGLIMAVFLTFTSFILIVEGRPILSSMLESRKRTGQFFKPLLFILTLQFLVNLTIHLIFQPQMEVESLSWSVYALISLINSYILAFFITIMFRYYLLQIEQTKAKQAKT